MVAIHKYDDGTEEFVFNAEGRSCRCFAFPEENVDVAINRFDKYKDKHAIYLYVGNSGNYLDRCGDVYVGQTKCKMGWADRIKDPHEDEDESVREWRENYWRYTYVFVPKNREWTEDELNYLEYMFYWVARIVDNYNLVNDESPSLGDVGFSSETRKEMNFVLVGAAEIMLCDHIPILRYPRKKIDGYRCF